MSRRGIEVELSEFEMYLAAQIGLSRQINAVRKGIRAGHGFDDKDPWTINVEGAGAEMAVAKWLDVHYSGCFGGFKRKRDVGSEFEVRQTDKDSGRLIIRSRDPFAIYILAVGKMPKFRLAGWFDYCSRAVVRDELLTNFDHPDRPKVCAVPQCELRPIEELRSPNAGKPIPVAENYSPFPRIPGLESAAHVPDCFCEQCRSTSA